MFEKILAKLYFFCIYFGEKVCYLKINDKKIFKDFQIYKKLFYQRFLTNLVN